MEPLENKTDNEQVITEGQDHTDEMLDIVNSADTTEINPDVVIPTTEQAVEAPITTSESQENNTALPEADKEPETVPLEQFKELSKSFDSVVLENQELCRKLEDTSVELKDVKSELSDAQIEINGLAEQTSVEKIIDSSFKFAALTNNRTDFIVESDYKALLAKCEDVSVKSFELFLCDGSLDLEKLFDDAGEDANSYKHKCFNEIIDKSIFKLSPIN